MCDYHCVNYAVLLFPLFLCLFVNYNVFCMSILLALEACAIFLADCFITMSSTDYYLLKQRENFTHLQWIIRLALIR